MKEYKVRIHSNGTKEWYLNNKLHSESGPAVERADGDKAWYINGRLHREDGPAVERLNGYKAWFLNGKKLSERSFNIHNKRNNVLPDVDLSLDKDSNHVHTTEDLNYVQEMNMKLKSMNKYYF